MSQSLARTIVHREDVEHARTQTETSAVVRLSTPTTLALRQALRRAHARVAPLWPLQSFVAVNPFLGLSQERFGDACQTMKRVADAHMLMPREHYLRLIAEGRITDQDLQEALQASSDLERVPESLASLKETLETEPTYVGKAFVTVAELLDRSLQLETETLAIGEIAKWCAAFWDEGQAAWRMPWRHLSFYPAWRAATAIDRTADVMGLAGFREAVASLPADPTEAIAVIVKALGLPPEALDGYLHRVSFGIRGWAGYARYLGWVPELNGSEDDTVTEVLAVRLAWDYALHAIYYDDAFRGAWQESISEMRRVAGEPEHDRALAVDAILQGAADASYRRTLIETVQSASNPNTPVVARKAVQAAFCIDVRSEVYRRALESVAPQADTIGFAGFFGFPIEYVPIGQPSGPAQCPVLLTPKFVVRETVTGAEDDETTEILGLRLLRRRASIAWKSFKSSAVSSFVFVETAGLAFAAKLVSDATGATRTVTDPGADGLDPKAVSRLGPAVAPGTLGVRQTGLTTEEQVATAESMLRGMSLTADFARLVMLAGHGSTTVNNPHASGYDCGACGGNPGDANARLAAAVLNDPDVRLALRERGIDIPSDTWFVGALHDTTTDDVTVFDRDLVPDSHAEDLRQLDVWLTEASSKARVERSALLNTGDGDVDAQVIARSRDWSQVRPEWGLARNAAFIAARRAWTRGVNLDGRVFLHDYDWRRDSDFGVLELIMTAPMVVASWINLQYYASAVDRDAFSSGNKVLHNVVGTLGVLEGNGGDLRVGLPWQSLHDGRRLVHEPLRLNVFLEAPIEQIDAVLEKHDNVRELVANGWLHLLAIADDGTIYKRDATEGTWAPTTASGS
ncbi:MAG: DUF2309 domain-containing protein [Polyangiales bacterium]